MALIGGFSVIPAFIQPPPFHTATAGSSASMPPSLIAVYWLKDRGILAQIKYYALHAITRTYNGLMINWSIDDEQESSSEL